jgi:hypothetical protein
MSRAIDRRELLTDFQGGCAVGSNRAHSTRLLCSGHLVSQTSEGTVAGRQGEGMVNV